VASGTADPATGGDIEGQLTSGQTIGVDVPSGAATAPLTVTITQFGAPPVPPPDGDGVVGLDFDLAAVDALTGQPVHDFAAPVTLTFGYPPQSDPSLLTFAFFDTTQNAWAPLIVTSIDTTNHLIEATTTHFTTFAVVSLPSPAYCADALHTDAFRGTGDINGDGHIDLTDFSTFAGDFGKTGALSSPYSDMNCDGKVDLGDFSIFATYYGR
jgi:hypothetical protein